MAEGPRLEVAGNGAFPPPSSTGPIHIPQVGKSRTLYFAQEMEVQLQLADHAPSA